MYLLSALWYHQQLCRISLLVSGNLSTLPCGQTLPHLVAYPRFSELLFTNPLASDISWCPAVQGILRKTRVLKEYGNSPCIFLSCFSYLCPSVHYSVSSVTQLMTLLESQTLPGFVVNGCWIFSPRSQKRLGTAVWAPEGWAISWELSPYIRMRSHPLYLVQPAHCVPDHVVSALNPRLPLRGGDRIWVMWFWQISLPSKAYVITAGRNGGVRRRVSWWLSTFSLADKGLKVLQLQKSLSFNKMDSGQPWRQEPFLFDSPSTWDRPWHTVGS